MNLKPLISALVALSLAAAAPAFAQRRDDRNDRRDDHRGPPARQAAAQWFRIKSAMMPVATAAST